MAFESEELGVNFRSRMPTLDSDASIQEAIKVYHFGVNNYSGQAIPRDSIEGHLSAISASVVANTNTIANLGTTYIEEISSAANPNEISAQTQNVVPLTIKGAINQIASLQRWVNSSNTPQVIIFNDGSLSVQGYATVGSIPASSPQTIALNINIANPSHRGLIIRSSGSQTANLQEWQNSSASVMARVDSFGKIYSNNGLTGTNTDEVTTISGTQIITNKTLTSPTINNAFFVGPREKTTVISAAPSGTVAYDCLSQTILFYTSNATENWGINFRGNSSVSMNSLLSVGDSITIVFLAQQGAVAYRPTVFQIDGSNIAPQWAGGNAPVTGNISSIDGYTFTIIKRANATFTLLGGQVQFK
jgi:hypothetical protein